jgi:hypothetical protein
MEISIGTQLGKEYQKKHTGPKISEFHMIVNPNVSSKPESEFHHKLHNDLINMMRAVFNKDFVKNYVNILIPDHGIDRIVNDPNDPNKMTCTLEYDSRHCKLHVDAYIKIKHYTRILLNQRKIVKDFARAAKVLPGNVHCHIRVIGAEQNERIKYKKLTEGEIAELYAKKSRNEEYTENV